MNNERKKELNNLYKQTKETGGIYRIVNTKNGKYLLLSCFDIRGARNRFDFSKNTNMCFHISMKEDFNKYGADAFEFEILEQIEMKETQTKDEFKEDLLFLENIWVGKFEKSLSY